MSAANPLNAPMTKPLSPPGINDNDQDDMRAYPQRDRSDSAYSGYSRAYTRVLTTTLFDMLEYVSPDDHEWTQDMLKSYGKIEEKGNEGTVYP